MAGAGFEESGERLSPVFKWPARLGNKYVYAIDGRGRVEALEERVELFINEGVKKWTD